MSRLRVAPIVEGHGEVAAVRELLRRVWTDLLGGEHIEVLKPIRVPRSKIVQSSELRRYVEIAALKLSESTVSGDPGLVLVLVDADTDAPCVLGPRLRQEARQDRGDLDVDCLVANVEYETWFVGAAESLRDYLRMDADAVAPEKPEEHRLGKAWVERCFTGTKYSEPVDQPRLTARMDMNACRARCPSFDKLCVKLARRLSART